jgi:hypothetical protein
MDVSLEHNAIGPLHMGSVVVAIPFLPQISADGLYRICC